MNTDDPSTQGCYSNQNDDEKNERKVYNEVVLDFVDIDLNKNKYVKLRLFEIFFGSPK